MICRKLNNYDKVKNNEQIMALVDFLEYLFLIENTELERRFKEYKKEKEGKFKMSIDEIRRIHYTQEGMKKGIETGEKNKAIKIAEKMLKKGTDISEIAELSIETIQEIKESMLYIKH